MGVIEGKIFKSGNSAAIRLPKELGAEIGMGVLLERVGNKIEVTLKNDPAEEKKRIAALATTLQDIWSDAPLRPERGQRDPVEIPARAAR